MNPAEKTDQILEWVFNFCDIPFQYDKKTIKLYKKNLTIIMD